MKLHWVSHWAHLKKRSDGKNSLARDTINIRKGLETKNRRIQEEATNLKKGLETKIDEGNKGYDLLKKMGYQDGQGLGKDGVGILQPLPLDVKTDRKGLGTPKKMVAPVQKESTKTEQAPKCKVNLVNTGALPKQTIKTEEKSTMLVDPKVSLPSPVWANQKQEGSNTQQPMIRARSKHSPIRSPESSPPRGGMITKPNGQGAIVKIEPRVTDVKVNLQQLIDSNSSEDPNFLKVIIGDIQCNYLY